MNHGHVKPREFWTRHNNSDSTMSIYRDGRFVAAIENTTASCDLFYQMNRDYQAALDEIEKLRERVENAIYYQEKAKNFISHYEDCDALTNPDFYSDGVSCECGMDSFAHDNYLSIEFSKAVLKESEARFPKEEK